MVVGLLAAASSVRSAEPNSLPPFKEVYDLLRTQLKGANEEELDHAAVQGLLSRFGSQVVLVTNTPGTNAVSPKGSLGSTALFDDVFAYMRVARVGPSLAKEMAEAYQRLAGTNRVKGLVVDLRFADGEDYAAAASAADWFFSTERPLIDWGEGAARSTAKTNAVAVPVVMLINHQTSGAAEALAGIFRQAEVGLLIGTNTAGRASVFKDFPLTSGQRLRIAAVPIKLGNGVPFPADGLKADIRVAVNPDDEKAYFEDAYKVLPRIVRVADGSVTMTNVTNLTVTNRPARRRINEAELVRLLRSGQPIEEEFTQVPLRELEPLKPVVNDPALARAIDLLKGLAVVQQFRPS
jgi:peptidase S41-like protein